MSAPLRDDTAAARAVEPVLHPGGLALLDSLPPYEEADALRRGASLREAGHSADLVSAVLTQSRLRARAREKFGEFADSMLFTPDGLEQATRLPVAALHAQRFRRAGVSSVADLAAASAVTPWPGRPRPRRAVHRPVAVAGIVNLARSPAPRSSRAASRPHRAHWGIWMVRRAGRLPLRVPACATPRVRARSDRA